VLCGLTQSRLQYCLPMQPLLAVALAGVLWRKEILLYKRIAAVMRYCRLVCV
jgi:hypothetical protein